MLNLFRQSTIQIYNQQFRTLSNKYALFTRSHRLMYLRLYPTVVVNPDGSTNTIRYPEPRKIIRLPLNLLTLSDEERRERLERRKPRKKVVIQDEIADTFSANRYLKLVKKR